MDEQVEVGAEVEVLGRGAHAAAGSLPALRFLTCGSVDDGKSTLIGRLLYEQQLILDDQLAALERDSRKHGTRRRGYRFRACSSMGSKPSASKASRSMSPIAISRRSSAPSLSPIRRAMSNIPAIWRPAPRTADLAILLVDARKGLLTQTHPPCRDRLAARHQACRAGGEQDRSRRLSTRRSSTASSPISKPSPPSLVSRRIAADPDLGALWRQYLGEERQDALVSTARR